MQASHFVRADMRERLCRPGDGNRGARCDSVREYNVTSLSTAELQSIDSSAENLGSSSLSANRNSLRAALRSADLASDHDEPSWDLDAASSSYAAASRKWPSDTSHDLLFGDCGSGMKFDHPQNWRASADEPSYIPVGGNQDERK